MLRLFSAVIRIKYVEGKTIPFYRAPKVCKAALYGKKQIVMDARAQMRSFVLAHATRSVKHG